MKTGQVFVSHTSDMERSPQGRSFVQAALDAVGRAGLAPVDMRYFSARDGQPADYCRQRVSECEVYVAVVGFSYGSLVAGEAFSYTELEFQVASEARIPRLVFLLEADAGPAAQKESDRGSAEGFRQRLRDNGLVVRTFTSADGLELEIFHALTELTLGDSGAQQPMMFAGILRQLRVEKRLTQHGLAGQAGLSLRSVSDLERGRRAGARPETIRRLADALNLTGEARVIFESVAPRHGPIPAIPDLMQDRSSHLQAPNQRIRPHAHVGTSRRGSIRAVPRVWNVPARNADFTGRDSIIGRLHEGLTGENRAVVLAKALYGLGGVGKTQVALEYAHRFQAEYDLVWWIPAEKPQEINLALAALASRLGIRTSDDAVEAAAAALERLRHGAVGRWLLIFDNADDPAGFAPFLPTGSGHVLITSRNHAWIQQAGPVELDVFTLHEAVTHLMRHIPELDRKDAERVAQVLGNLPLAIEQAAAWLTESGMSAEMYIEWLEAQANHALSLGKPADYAMPVAATWNLSFDRLNERSPAAVRLLQILAFCAPGPISIALLYSNVMIEFLLPYDHTLGDKFMFGRIVGEISRLALVRIDLASNSLQIHRLVQTVIRSQMTNEQQNEVRHEVHRVLAGARPPQGDVDDPVSWSAYDTIWSHLSPSRAEECADPRTRQLLIDWVRYQWRIGEFKAGLDLARRLENLWLSHLGPDHPQTLHLQFNIANYLRVIGLFREARDLDAHVLERQQAVLGADHLHSLWTAFGLGADLRALGDYQQALSSDRKTYGRLKELFGDEHPRTIAAAHNLACSLRLTGDCYTARSLDEKTLDRAQIALGPEHPYSLLAAASLANDLREAGQYRDSAELLHCTWRRYRAVLGDDDPETLRAASNLAVSLRKTGKVSEALELARDTYERCRNRYGDGALDARACALIVACAEAAGGNILLALEMATAVWGAHRTGLGSDNPSTMAAANNVACYLRCAGRTHEALPLAEETRHRLQQKLGATHPRTLSCTINAASCHGDSGNLVLASTLQFEVLAQLTQTRGPEHPDILIVKANLAATLHRSKVHKEAGQLREQVLDGLRQTLGSQHPDIALLRHWAWINLEQESPVI